MMGARDEDTVSSLAGRLARLNRQLDRTEQARIKEQAGGVELNRIVGDLLAAIDTDRIQNGRARSSPFPMAPNRLRPPAIELGNS